MCSFAHVGRVNILRETKKKEKKGTKKEKKAKRMDFCVHSSHKPTHSQKEDDGRGKWVYIIYYLFFLISLPLIYSIFAVPSVWEMTDEVSSSSSSGEITLRRWKSLATIPPCAVPSRTTTLTKKERRPNSRLSSHKRRRKGRNWEIKIKIMMCPPQVRDWCRRTKNKDHKDNNGLRSPQPDLAHYCTYSVDIVVRVCSS